MSYGILVWSLTAQKNLDKISVLQRKCIRIINSAAFNEHSNSLFIKNEIIKFTDIIKINQLLFANQFYNETLPADLKNFFKYCSEVHTYQTRSSNSALFIPSISTTNYGINSIKFQVPFLWNKFSKAHIGVCERSYKSLKMFLNKYFIDKYKEELLNNIQI